MKPNFIDRALAAVAPQHALARMGARLALEAQQVKSEQIQQFSALTSSSDQENTVGGSTGLLRWWRPGVRDAAGDSLSVLRMQRGQSRELARVNPLAAGAINTNVDRVVGTGLALAAQPNRDVLGWESEQALQWKRKTQTEFSLWADSCECDISGEQNFYEKQGLTLRSALESGDCFTLMPDAAPSATQPYRLRLQTLEADRIGNPNNGFNTAEVAGGVRRTGGSAAASAYYVYDTHPGSIFLDAKPRFHGVWVDRVGGSGRRRILHHFRQLRPEQPRGVPYLAPVVECIKQLARYTEAEIQAAIVSAFFTVIVETETGTGPAPIFGATDAQVANDPEIALGPAAVIGLAKGEKANFANPTRPNTAFEPFVLAIIKQIGVGLNMPYELLVKQFNASYSASRAALLDAWLWFRSQRTWLSRSFCQPVYETWMAEAVATGRIVAPGFFSDPLLRWAYTRAAWHGDSQGSINPKDEVTAYLAAVDGRIMTRERAEWEMFGSDWYETLESKETEQVLLKESDLLPVPKAGAPTPADVQPQSDKQTGALASLAASVAELSLREPAAPNVTLNLAAPTVTVQPPHIEIVQGDTHITLPESNIQLDAHIEQPDVTVHPAVVHVELPTPQVTVHQVNQATKQTLTRDEDGEVREILTVPIPAPATH